MGYLEPEQVPLLDGLHSVLDALGVAVGKAHHSPGQPAGGDWTALLAAGRLLPVMTLRDPRDVVASFARTYGQTPDEVLTSRRWALNLGNVRWWLDVGALPAAYVLLRADPARVVADVAARLGLAVDPRHLASVVEAGAPPGGGGCPVGRARPAHAAARRSRGHAGGRRVARLADRRSGSRGRGRRAAGRGAGELPGLGGAPSGLH